MKNHTQMKNVTSIPRRFWQESQTSWPEGELLCEGRRPSEEWASWESPLGGLFQQ